MELSEEQIIEINKKCPYNQGVFFEPYGIPIKLGERVIYNRYETGGYSGGSCWEDSDPQWYEEGEPKDSFKVLDLVLEVLRPNITYLQFKQIKELVHENSETEYEYYGNSTDWCIQYIKLSDLYNLLVTF